MRILRAFTVSLWILAFGLLPIWVTWGWLLRESRGASDDYWLVAPWMIVFAMPLCTISLTIAALSWLVYSRVTGGRWRKLSYAGSVCLLLSAGAAFLVQARWETRQAETAAAADQMSEEKAAARLAVEQSDLVASSVRGEFRVGSPQIRTNRDGIPIRFVMRVHAPRSGLASVVAIVDVTRASGAAEFNVTCVIAPEEYQQLDAQEEPCRSNAARRGD